VELDAQRLAVVREHMESENAQDFDRTIATLARPRYELMATGDVFDGDAEVRDYYARTRSDFPDQRNESRVSRSTSDGVVVEFDLLASTPFSALRSGRACSHCFCSRTAATGSALGGSTSMPRRSAGSFAADLCGRGATVWTCGFKLGLSAAARGASRGRRFGS
jgi:hypothetical protein